METFRGMRGANANANANAVQRAGAAREGVEEST
jgi:hypothetical protein